MLLDGVEGYDKPAAMAWFDRPKASTPSTYSSRLVSGSTRPGTAAAAPGRGLAWRAVPRTRAAAGPGSQTEPSRLAFGEQDPGQHQMPGLAGVVRLVVRGETVLLRPAGGSSQVVLGQQQPGPPMAALLGWLIAAQRTGQAAVEVPLECLARLQHAFHADSSTPEHRPGTAAAVRGIVEPLTSRELEVLQMLAAGMSNQDIARELVVSLDTVKKHVSHVLGKLVAASCTEAVARVRQLDLIL